MKKEISNLLELTKEYGNLSAIFEVKGRTVEIQEHPTSKAACHFDSLNDFGRFYALMACLFNVYSKSGASDYAPQNTSQTVLCKLDINVFCSAISTQTDEGYITKLLVGEKAFVDQLLAANVSLLQERNGNYLLSVETTEGLCKVSLPPSQMAAMVNGKNAVSELRKFGKG